ncbi:MAG: MoaD/ThiS family protein [Pirellulaceae bacterium]
MLRVTVRLFAGLAIPIPGQVIQMELPEGTTVQDLMARMEVDLAVEKLATTIVEHCLVMVDGTEVRYLGGWGAGLRDGALIGIVPAMVGG